MVRKICPVCDQVMKYPHYCPNCGSWVKHPHIQEVNYYLNERHPQREAACSYHGNTAAASQSPPGIQRPPAASQSPPGIQRPPAASQSPPGNQRPPAANGSKGTAGWVMQGGSGQPDWGMAALHPGKGHSPSTDGAIHKNKSSSFAVIAVAAGIAVFLLLFVAAQLCIKHSVGVSIPYEDSLPFEEDWWDGDLEEYTMDYDYDGEDSAARELSDEDVVKAGEKCSENGHFGISGAEIEEFTRQALKEYGCDPGEGQISRTSCNREYQDYDGEYTYTDYSTYVTIWVREAAGSEDYGDYGEYVEICYDTATGQLHGIELGLEDREMLAGLSYKMMEQLGRYGGFTEGNWSDSVRRDMPRVLDTSNGYSLQAGNLFILGYGYEGMYWFNVSLTGELEETKGPEDESR